MKLQVINQDKIIKNLILVSNNLIKLEIKYSMHYFITNNLS